MKPLNLPLRFTRGDDAQVRLVFQDATGAAFDLTGWNLSASVWDDVSSPDPLVSFTTTVSDAVLLTLEEEQTAALPARAWWWLRAHYPATDLVQTWLGGGVRTDYLPKPDLDPNDFTIKIDESIVVVASANIGPAGPKGDPGEPGLQGTTGPSGGSYEHTQVTPGTVWTIQHNLGYRPAGLHIITDAGDEVEPASWAYSSADITVLTFTESYSGTAYLS